MNDRTSKSAATQNKHHAPNKLKWNTDQSDKQIKNTHEQRHERRNNKSKTSKSEN